MPDSFQAKVRPFDPFYYPHIPEDNKELILFLFVGYILQRRRGVRYVLRKSLIYFVNIVFCGGLAQARQLGIEL